MHFIWSSNKTIINTILRAIGKDNYFTHNRNVKIYHKGRLINYPFEHGLARLSKEENFRCLKGFIEAINSKNPEPNNVYDWCYKTFGKGISKSHLIPVNKNWWKINPKQLSLELVKRIPQPTLNEVIKSSLGIETTGLKEQKTMYYPKHGGCHAIAESLINSRKKLKKNIKLNEEVMWMEFDNSKNKWMIFTDKSSYCFDRVVSTIPLHSLVKKTDVDKPVKKMIRKLKFNSLVTVFLGLDKDIQKNYSWINFGTKDMVMNRISFPKTSSPFNAPDGKSSVLAEISFRRFKPKNIEGKVVENLTENIKLINSSDVLFTEKRFIKYAYPVPDLYYANNITNIRKYFEDKGIILAGRFGGFNYINMDKCMIEVKDITNRLFK